MTAGIPGRRLVVASAGVMVVAAIVTSLTGTLAARQAAKPAAGARIFVVAVRDSTLFTLCPVAGREVLTPERQVFTGLGPDVKAVLYLDPALSFQSVQVTSPAWLRTRGATRGTAQLPPPPSEGARTSALRPAYQVVTAGPAASAPELERLALDPDVRASVEKELRGSRRYAVVDSLDGADFVFVVETSYIVMSAYSVTGDAARTPPVPGIEVLSDGTRVLRQEREGSGGSSGVSWGGDHRLNWRQAALAVAVPADVYRRFPADGAKLTSSRIWEGFSLEETIRGDRGLDIREGRAELLAAEFAGKWREPIAALPVCAASTGPLRVASTSAPASSGASSEAPEGAAGSAQPPRQPSGVFRSGVTLVRVPFTVADDNGRAIIGVSPSELHLFEDGVEQRINTVLPASASTSLALLLDLSDSMRQYRQDLRSAALSLADLLRPADRLLVASFDARVRVLAEFTRDAATLRRAAVADLPRGQGGTRLYDAIDLVSEDRLREVDGRAAMVVVTDGIDTYSRIVDAAGTRDAIDEANVAVYAIRYDTGDTLGKLPFRITVGPPREQGSRASVAPPKLGPKDPAPAGLGGRWLVLPDDVFNGVEVQNAADQFLSRLSTTSGGRMYYAPAGTDLRDVFANIIEELSRQSTICYYPANAKADGTFRGINVTIDRPGHTVRARKGYRAANR